MLTSQVWYVTLVLQNITEKTAVNFANPHLVSTRVAQMARRPVRRGDKEKTVLIVLNSSKEITVKNALRIIIPRILARLTALLN